MTELEDARARLGLRLLLKATPLLYPGRKIARLTLQHYIPSKDQKFGGRRNGEWVCLCDCGTHMKAQVNNITSGKTKSCGCLRESRWNRRVRA